MCFSMGETDTDDFGLEFFNIRGLKAGLCSLLADEEGSIELVKKRDKELRKPLVLRGLRTPQRRVIFKLSQSVTEAGIFCQIQERDYHAGDLVVESGVFEDQGDMAYESLKLKLKYPLQFSGGKVIPECEIYLDLENKEGLSMPQKVRTDYVFRSGIWRPRKIMDLSGVLPTNLFLFKEYQE